MKKTLLAAVVVAGLAGPVPPGSAQAPSAPLPGLALEPARIVTSSKRLMVTGRSSAENLATALWLEKALERVELFTGSFPVFSPHIPIAVHAREQEDVPPKVLRFQNVGEGMFSQKLVIFQPDAVDQEDILEGLCWLALNRIVFQAQSIGARGRPPGEIPDWVAVGLAQNLYPGTKDRNHKQVMAELGQNRMLPAARIMQQAYLPYGRWREKTYCGVFSEWLYDEAGAPRILSALCRAVADERAVTPAWLTPLVGPDPAAAWIAWLTDRTETRVMLGPLNAHDLARFRGILAIGSERWREMAGDRPYPDINAQRLVHLRNEDWAPAVIERLREDTVRFMLGRPQAFQEAAKAYVAYFDALTATRGKKNFKKALKAWKRAEETLAAYEQEHLRRIRYIDEIARDWSEARASRTVRPPPVDPRERVRRQMELHTYMNAMERMLDDIRRFSDATP